MGSHLATRASRFASAEFWVFGLLLLGAAAARFWGIGHLPDGIHGDEAWTGLDARRILNEGWIGPYVPSALGQPSGLLYVVAGLFFWLPDDIATIRGAIAGVGILGVVFTYLLAREYEGPVFAICAAALLAGSLWHLHASRIGMMFVSCPTFLMAGLWMQAVAVRRRTFAAAAAAGLVAGLGVYSYNAYPTAVPLYAIPFLYAFASAPSGRERIRVCLRTGAFALAALAAAAPLIVFAARDPGSFFRHHKQVSMFASAAWTAGDWPTRAGLFAARARFWLEGLFVQGRFDSGDGYGVAGIPLVDAVTAGLALAGLILALVRWRRPLSLLMIAACPLLSLGALLTDGPGAFRRTIALAPFIAMLAAAPLAALYQAGRLSADRGRSKWPMRAAIAGAFVVIALSIATNVRAYFGPFTADRQLRWVYARELRAASEYLARVPKGTRVYFFSERWSCHYETRQYLAPGVECVDRSRRFGRMQSRSGLLKFSTPPGVPALLLLMGEHMRQIDPLVQRHPEAKVDFGEIDGERVFAALYLPEGEARRVGAGPPVTEMGNSIVSLAALEPLDVRYDFEPPRINQTWNAQPIELNGRRFARGIGMHAPTEVVYAVPAGAARFVATVGLAPQVASCANASVVFEVLDPRGRVLASSDTVRAGDPAAQLRAEVRGLSHVVLVAGDAGDGRDCDHANWGNPVFLPGPAVRRTAAQPRVDDAAAIGRGQRQPRPARADPTNVKPPAADGPIEIPPR